MNRNRYINKTAPAFLTVLSGTRLLKHSTSFLRENTVIAPRKSTANVAVFIPPAVDPGHPPISISTIIISVPDSDICERSCELKPAVLAVTDWNAELSVRSFRPRPEYSQKKKYTAGMNISSREVVITTLLWREYFLNLNLYVITSFHVRKPMPPTMMSSIITMLR